MSQGSRREPWQESAGAPVLRFKGKIPFFSLSLLNIAQLMNVRARTGRAEPPQPPALGSAPGELGELRRRVEPGDSRGWTPLPAGIGPRSGRGRRMRHAGAGFIPAPLPEEIPHAGKRSSGLSGNFSFSYFYFLF